MAKANGRCDRGKFAPGNPGGPGRPRRAVEREYVAVLSDVVTVDVWRDVVTRAVEDAKAGNARARDWLSRYVLGAEPLNLLALAAIEHRGETVDDAVAETAERQKRDAALLDELRGRL